MLSASEEFRTRAELLQARVEKQDPQALKRMLRWRLPVEGVQRRDCLTAVAREAGFKDWPHAKRVLEGEDEMDFADLLCPTRMSPHLNQWFRNHAEATVAPLEAGAYLLAYRRQFFIADRHYIEALGLDPADVDWTALGFDWSRAGGGPARARLYAKLVERLPRES